MATLADIAAGRAGWDGKPVDPNAVQAPSNTGLLDQQQAAPSYTLADMASGKISFDENNKLVVHDDQPDPNDDPQNSPWRDAYGILLNTGMGFTTGLEAAGALTQLALPEFGETLRQTGRSGSDYLKEKMSPEWQEAIERSWLDLSKEGAFADPRSWIAGIAQTVPYMLMTGGAGEVASLGIRATGLVGKQAATSATTTAGRIAAEQAALRTSRVLGYGTAGGAAGAGEAAAGAAAASDANNLTPEERQVAMWAAAPIGAAAGAIVGPKIEKLLSGAGGSIGKRLATGATAEAIEEGGTQFGTETGKAVTGQGFDPLAIAEAAVGGAVIGGPAGAILSGPGSDRLKQKAASARAGEAEAFAIMAEADRQQEQMRSDASAAIQANRAKQSSAQLLLPAPTDAQAASGVGSEQFNPQAAPTLPGQRPPAVMEGPATATAEAASIPYQMMTEAGKGYYDKLEGDVTAVEAELAEIQTQQQSAASMGDKLKFKQRFKETKKRYEEAVRLRDGFTAKLDSLYNRVATDQLALPGFEEIDTSDYNFDQNEAIRAMQDTELESTLNKWFKEPRSETDLDEDNGYSEPIDDRPFVQMFDKAELRSLRAKKGAETKRAKALAAAETGPGQNIVTMPTRVATADTAPPATGIATAEADAIRARVPQQEVRQAAFAAEPGPLTVPPTAQPMPPQPNGAGVPLASGGGGAASPGALARPVDGPNGAGVVPAGAAPAPAAIQQPVLVDGPAVPQKGGVTSAPTAPDLMVDPLDEIWAQGNRQLNVLPGVGQSGAAQDSGPTPQKKTQPRKKPIGKMTPSERLKHTLADGPKDIRTVLAALKDSFSAGKQPRAIKLIDRLIAALPVRSEIKPLMVRNGRMTEGFQGLYDPKTDVISVDLMQAEDPVLVVLHEAVHAATLGKLRTNRAFRKNISLIMSDAALMWSKLKYEPRIVEGQTEFLNPEEFIAHALTNFAFQDNIAGMPASAEIVDKTVWMRLRDRLQIAFGTKADVETSDLFQVLLDFVPDGNFLQDGNREELLQQMDNLGLSQPVASMLSSFRSMLRSTATNPVNAATVASGGGKRVWETTLPFMSTQQIANSYGEMGRTFIDPQTGATIQLKHDAINEYARTVEAKAGYIDSIRAVADKIISVGKQAAQEANGTEKVDNILVDSRYWSLHPDKSAVAPENLVGIRQPGGIQLHRELVNRWNGLTAIQRDFFRLIRDNSTAQRADHINQIMVWRVRARIGQAAADTLSNLLYNPSRAITNAGPSGPPSGVEITYQKPLDVGEARAFVTTLGLPAARSKLVMQDIVQVLRAYGKEHGPYVPLRRTGTHYTLIESGDFKLSQRPITPTEFDNAVAQNKLTQGGDMEIVDDGFDPTTGMYDPTVRHKIVSSHDSEQDAKDALDEYKTDWASRSINIKTARPAIKADNVYAAMGLQSSSVEAMRREVEAEVGKTMGPGTAKAVSDQILKYYLEKLPESSARKGQLRAKKTAGATRDMMHVYSEYANGAAYISGQMKYGQTLASLLTQKMSEDIKTMQDRRAYDQANDVAIIQSFLGKKDANYDRLQAQDITRASGWLKSVWRQIPQVTGAWLLTGPATVLTNSMQVWQVGLPYFGARHGYVAAAASFTRAYKDVFNPIALETGAEFRRFGKGIPAAGKVAAGVQRFTPTIKNPRQSMYERVMSRLTDPGEQAAIKALALRKKIDFGLVADIKSIADRAGGKWMALQYMMDGAFIMPQAAETMNRIVSGLSSYRLNKAKITAAVNADATVQPADKAKVIQQRLIDEAAKDIDSTQWNYGAENRPLAFQSEVLRAALVFKTYPQSMWYSLVHNMLQSMHATTKAERKIARKFIGGMFVTTMISSGLVGWLAFDPFYLAAVALTAGFTDEDDPEQALRDGINEFVGEDWTDYLVRGVPYGSGLADTANRMGLPTFFPLQDLFRGLSGRQSSYDTIAGMVGETIMGAPGSVAGETLVPAAGALVNGDYATAREKLMPKAFGLQDALAAWNYHNRGVVDTRGNTTVKPKDISYGELLRKALGFEPPEIAERKAINRNLFATDQKRSNQKDELIASFAEAHQARDLKARNEVLREIQRWNRGNPGYKITRSGLRSSVRYRTKGEYLVAKYGANARTRGQRAVLAEIEDRYNN